MSKTSSTWNSYFRPNKRRHSLKAVCFVCALCITSCGGGGGGSGGSSSGGGNAAIGSAVISLAAYLGYQLLKNVENNLSTANAASDELVWQFTPPDRVKTQGSIGFAALSSDFSLKVRNYQFCQAFLRAALRANVRNSSVGVQNTRVNTTVWPIRDAFQSLDKTDCNQLISAHDFEYSKNLFNIAKLTSPRGPVLISRQRLAKYNDDPIASRPIVVWDLSPIDDADLPLTLLAWAQMLALSDDELKKAFAEASFEDTVVKIAEISASRVYQKRDIQITFISAEK